MAAFSSEGIKLHLVKSIEHLQSNFVTNINIPNEFIQKTKKFALTSLILPAALLDSSAVIQQQIINH